MVAMTPEQLLAAWEDAYLAQSQNARIGRLFKGTIHNLNGIIQVFSMQSELFDMMFASADELLDEALSLCGEDAAQEKIGQTRALLHKRHQTLAQVEEKIVHAQQILKNNDEFFVSTSEGGLVSLQSLVDNVVSFFTSQMFFKHKVEKDVRVDADLSIGRHGLALTIALANLIENSIEAMERHTAQSGFFALRCFLQDNRLIMEVEDNGVGVPESIQADLFQPFVAAGPGHAGLGLYLARRVLADLGATVAMSRASQPTIFTITLPDISAVGESLV